jgi:hypothetical protein
MFEIIYENINDIDHNNDAWAKRDSQMKLENIETVIHVPLKESKKTKKKTKIIKKIEKEYEIVNEIINNEPKDETLIEEIIQLKKQENLKTKLNLRSFTECQYIT